MGVSNSEMFLTEKDLTSSMEISFLVRRRPPLVLQQGDECQITTFQDDYDEPQQQKEERLGQDQQEDKCKTLKMAPLELKLPCPKVDDEEDRNNDGFKTPTSSDHKIPVILKCPPAPRKPKSLPISPKRKAFGRRILLDFTKEMESLFPPALLADLGNKIKKVRQGSDFN
ncbi:hypothetical protein ERO13_A07G098000v2 [Gossypium hirsutum]|uniref:Cyclin-dependent protein kinase inhibitor SMR3-like n=3 Tax=Gossypium TaxID=3633 RepID=A0ABR0PAS0_GOSAR|nr:cyclin-dependent protein kinase inhibitor SMR3-like [Gossypium hirsutum]XP_017625628.1 cyclin-dependent protein kinase inhibitor SMR3 [Gossypium arboreum]KAG4191507.1 hypothetical protein ERO13_A07G098000v2 [Gossypium hirsutum]KAK5818311.1 hypothetical protein PVK06_023246 [Gossypium arboreum]TYI18740.1 hypothetical protein ES332_A07G113700v1 [Gossypium tomentosum]